MLNESEIRFLNAQPEINEKVLSLKNEFKSQVAPYLDITTQDFLSLLLLSPMVGKAMADETLSFKEEIALQKKARKLSKGGFFISKDPVADAMKFYLKYYKDWEGRFYACVKEIVEISLSDFSLDFLKNDGYSYEHKVMYSPYLLIRYLSAFFLEKDESLFQQDKIKQVELNKMKEIAKAIGFSNHSITDDLFKRFVVK